MIISLKNVEYTYPLEKRPTIKGINLELEKGKVYGIIGENQSGKTTLCNIIRGFIPEIYRGNLVGDIKLKGKNLNEYSLGDLAKIIGFAFQNPFTQISGVKETVYEELAYGLENLGLPREEIIKRVDQVIEYLKLENLKEKNPYELSGGQKQRVALGAVIAMEPEIIIMDEPTSQLDPQSTEDIFKIIEILKKQNKTIILVEHKIDLMAEYCDEIILMKDGKILLKDLTKKIFTNIDILNYGVQLPQVALYFLKKLKEEKQDIPITISEVKKSEIFRNR